MKAAILFFDGDFQINLQAETKAEEGILSTMKDMNKKKISIHDAPFYLLTEGGYIRESKENDAIMITSRD